MSLGGFPQPLVIQDSIKLQNGYETRFQLTLPPGTDPKSVTKSLPVMLYVYGGPGSQSVKKMFSYSIREYLSLKHGFAIVQIDGRGSQGRGWKYRSPIYGQLGTVEMEDQIEAINLIIGQYPMLDRRRLSVFGWSYGGYAAAHISEQAPKGAFKCAVSVAPVSNFRYYDATYTERYMGNATSAAYDRGDISKKVGNFKQTQLLLMHGLFDENVHFQNSAMFIWALQDADINFDLMVFPNDAHSISNYPRYVYQKMEDFLVDCLHLDR